MTYLEIVRELKRDGWFETTCEGSHQHFKHPVKSGKITVLRHTGDIPLPVLRRILRNAGLQNRGKK